MYISAKIKTLLFHSWNLHKHSRKKKVGRRHSLDVDLITSGSLDEADENPCCI